MAILDLPSGIIISDVIVTQITPQFVTTSLNNKRRVKTRGIHQLSGSFKVRVSGDREQRAFDAWLLGMGGRLNQFNLKLGGRFTAETSRVRNVNLSTNVGIGANKLSLANFIGNVWAGDYFNLPNDSKVYMAMNDMSGSGGILNIYPPLRQQQLTNTTLQLNDVNVLAMLDADEQPVTYSEGGIITEYDCKWRESL